MNRCFPVSLIVLFFFSHNETNRELWQFQCTYFVSFSFFKAIEMLVASHKISVLLCLSTS